MPCKFSLNQVAEATGGEILSSMATDFVGVGTDSRQNLKGQIFFALKGDSHDAHKFLEAAMASGASCLVVHDRTYVAEPMKAKVSIVLVKDTLTALQNLAKSWRRQLKGTVFGITGSNGKSTTKDFTAAVLGAQFKVFASHGSFNNHWGVPISILAASTDDDAIVLEMGMNHVGELEQLSKIAEPNVVICTTVGRAHVGNFKNGQQGVAEAKEEIYLANPKAVKIFNYDNEYTIKMFERVSKLQGTERTIVFSTFSAGAEVSLRANNMTLDGLHVIGQIGGVKGEAKVKVFGRHNVTNLMAAASMALTMKMEPEKIWKALERCTGQWGRNQLVPSASGAKVLFDGYNANPDSMTTLIKNMLELNASGGKKIFVIGEMLELGSETEKSHREIGELLSRTDVEVIWFIGASRFAFEFGLRHSGWSKTLYSSAKFDESIASTISKSLTAKDLVFVKGSRGTKTEQVVKALCPDFQGKT